MAAPLPRRRSDVGAMPTVGSRAWLRYTLVGLIGALAGKQGNDMVDWFAAIVNTVLGF